MAKPIDHSLMNPKHIQQYLPVWFFQKLSKTVFCPPARNFLNRNWHEGSTPKDVYDLAPLFWIFWLLTAIDDGVPGFLRGHGDFTARAHAFLSEVLFTFYPQTPESMELLELYHKGDSDGLSRKSRGIQSRYDAVRLDQSQWEEGGKAEPLRVLWHLAEFLHEGLQFHKGGWYHFNYLSDSISALLVAHKEQHEYQVRAIWDKHIPFDTFRNTLEAAFNQGQHILLKKEDRK